MTLDINEEKLVRTLSFGLFAVTVAVATGGITDPVNTPKLAILGIFAISSLGLYIAMPVKRSKFWLEPLTLSIAAFLVFALTATMASDSPISQNLYGVYGRNNGLLTYIFFSIILFIVAQIGRKQNLSRVIKALTFSGYVNLIYCLWVILFGDFMPWTNTYGNILGTFGNPNFIGAFLGIFFGVLLASFVSPETSFKDRIWKTPVLLVTLFEIYQSKAIQGIVLALIAVSVVTFYLIRAHFGKNILLIYIFVCATAGGLGIAGALQKGPLADLIYKNSISLRGQYWLAALNTGNSNPYFGVGMDSFGDWYRRSRDIRALESPGLNVVVNTAHNVPLDMFAFGGWPLLLSYLLITALAAIALAKITIRTKGYDSVGVAISTSWVCYQAQSLISINQIGLAIWGWALSGALIGYEKFLSDSETSYLHGKRSNFGKKNIVNDLDPKTLVYGITFGISGLLIAVPPLSSDVKLRSAQLSLSAEEILKTTQVSYFNPLNTQKFIYNIQSLETGGLFSQSRQQALQGVNWNPESFELWRLLYLIKNSTPDEKAEAIRNMKRLDPFNTKIESTE